MEPENIYAIVCAWCWFIGLTTWFTYWLVNRRRRARMGQYQYVRLPPDLFTIPAHEAIMSPPEGQVYTMVDL